MKNGTCSRELLKTLRFNRLAATSLNTVVSVGTSGGQDKKQTRLTDKFANKLYFFVLPVDVELVTELT